MLKVFGIEHFVCLAVIIVMSIISIILIKKYVKSEKGKDIIIKVVAGLLLALVVWNRITKIVIEGDWTEVFLDSFCCVSSFALALACLFGKKDNAVIHFAFYINIVGGVLTLIYPNFIEYSTTIFDTKSLSALLFHSVGIYICILLLMFGYFKPDYKRWGSLVIGFMACITLGTFEIFVLDSYDAFFIIYPVISGTPLTVWLLAVLFVVLYIIFFVIYELCKWKKSKRNENDKKIEN